MYIQRNPPEILSFESPKREMQKHIKTINCLFKKILLNVSGKKSGRDSYDTIIILISFKKKFKLQRNTTDRII